LRGTGFSNKDVNNTVRRHVEEWRNRFRGTKRKRTKRAIITFRKNLEGSEKGEKIEFFHSKSERK